MSQPITTAKPVRKRDALLASLIYAALASVWMLGSDRLFDVQSTDPGVFASLQAYKGSVLVVVTALALYALLRRPFASWRPNGRAEHSKRSLYRLHVLVIGVSGVLITVIVVSFAINTWLGRRALIAAADQEARGLVRIVEDQTTAWTNAADLALRFFSDAAPLRPYARGNDAEIKARMNEVLGISPMIRKLVMTDAAGRVTHESDSDSGVPADQSSQEYFRVHRDAPSSGLYVSRPGNSSRAGQPTFTVSRSLSSADGKFLGVISGDIGIANLQKVYDALETRYDRSIVLARRDGVVLVRSGRERGPVAATDAQLPDYIQYLLKDESGTYRSAAAEGGMPWIFSYRGVPGRPLVVALGLDEKQILSAWQNQSLLYGGVAGAVILTIIWFALLIFRDMTRREALLIELRESELRFRNLVETASEGIWMIDTQSHVTFVNPRMAEMLGYSAGEMLGRPISNFTDESSQAEAHGSIEACRRGKVSQWDFCFLRKDGGKLWTIVSSKPVFDQMGVYAGSLGMITDITERKNTEQRILTSEASLAAAQRITHLGSWEIDLENRVAIKESPMRWSDETYRIFGYAPGQIEVSNASFMGAVHSPDRARVAHAVAMAVDTGMGYRMDYSVIRPDGTQRYIRQVSGIVLDDMGVPSRIMGTVLDITGQMRTETHLRQARERLQALSNQLLECQETERADLARELHDEFGQTLTAVKLQLQLAVKRTPALPLDDCVSIVDHALDQVRSLSLNLRPSQLDTHGLDAALQPYLERLSRQTGIAMTLEAPPNGPSLQGPRATACFRIAQEAVTNAMRHAKAKNIHVKISHDNGVLVLSVSDDGVGFNPRTKRAVAVKGGSLGLLSMEERALVLGGAIDIRSAIGTGTEVIARIPERPMEEAAL